MNTSPLASDMMGTQLTELPPGLSTSVRTLATRETAEYTGRFQKAVALQNYLRDNGDYELDNSVDGSGSDTLEAFLDEGSPGALTGYCEQFAAAMAVMARTINIPSRVAIGFLKPTESAPGTYVYSLRDLHAWPELYFPGAGWVRFEPTPSQRADDGAGVHGVRVPGRARDRPAQQRGFRGRREPAHPRCRPQGAEPPGPGRRRPVVASRGGRSRSACSPWRCSSGWRCCRGSSGVGGASAGWPRAPSPCGSSCATPWSTSASPGPPVDRRERPGRTWCTTSAGRWAPTPRTAPATVPTCHPRASPPCTGSSPPSSSRGTPAPAPTRRPSSRPTPRP